MAKSSSSSDRTKKIILIGLFVVMAGVAVYRFLLESPEPKRKGSGSNSNSTAQTRTVSTRSSAPAQSSRAAKRDVDDDALIQQLLADTTPLNLNINLDAGSATPNRRGNIFAQYVEPIKETPPPPPPPITLQFIQPQSVIAGVPRKFTLTVVGKAIPADGQILFNGSPKPTKRINDTTLSTEIAPAEYSSTANIRIEIKSQSDPVKLYSNQVSFIVQPSPEPPFKYTSYFKLGNWGLFENVSSPGRDVKRATVGDIIGGVWRVDSVNNKEAEITHTQYEIKRRLIMQPRPGS